MSVAPMTLGHEIIGRIEAVGSGVPSDRVGERVIVYYYIGCGVTTAVHAVRLANLAGGDWAVVYGVAS